MFDKAPEGYQDLEYDNSKPKWRESRIRKLRRMKDVRNYEKAKYLKKVKEQYGAQPAAEPTV